MGGHDLISRLRPMVEFSLREGKHIFVDMNIIRLVIDAIWLSFRTDVSIYVCLENSDLRLLDIFTKCSF